MIVFISFEKAKVIQSRTMSDGPSHVTGYPKLTIFSDDSKIIEEFQFDVCYKISGWIDRIDESTKIDRQKVAEEIAEIMIERFPIFDKLWLQDIIFKSILFEVLKAYRVNREKEKEG